jgi:hypothetical protein
MVPVHQVLLQEQTHMHMCRNTNSSFTLGGWRGVEMVLTNLVSGNVDYEGILLIQGYEAG